MAKHNHKRSTHRAASAASGDSDRPSPASAAAIAPAPSWSSTHGRSGPKVSPWPKMFTPQRSPAATRPIGPPGSCAFVATAEALRRQPARTRAPVAAAVSQSVAPLGEGSASSVPGGFPSQKTAAG